MSQKTFQAVLEAVDALEPKPTVFFQGFGEPLMHPRIVEMVAAVHRRGARVELITNRILRTEKKVLQLTRAGIDGLWVSIDGASPASCADMRLGASLPTVNRNRERSRGTVTLRLRAHFDCRCRSAALRLLVPRHPERHFHSNSAGERRRFSTEPAEALHVILDEGHTTASYPTFAGLFPQTSIHRLIY